MKNRRAARTHIVSELGPAAAAVAVQRRLSTATMLNNTRSRRVRTRGRFTCCDRSAAGAEMVLIRSWSFLEIQPLGVEYLAQELQLPGGRWLVPGQWVASPKPPSYSLPHLGGLHSGIE